MRRPHRYSQCGKLLARLEVGGWWSTYELIGEVPCIVHSRISELRKMGYTIEHRTTGPGARGSEYRLALEEPAPPVTSGSAIPLRGAGSSSAATGSEQEPVLGAGSPAVSDGTGSTTSSVGPVALDLHTVYVSNMPLVLFDPVLLQEC